MREEVTNRAPEVVIARLAARQHGVVSREQLERVRIRRQSLTRRVQAGKLHRIHRGVFAVGHPGLSKAGRWMAAVLACGEGAVLSHASAGELWGMLRTRRPPSPAAVDVDAHVTVASQSGRRRRRGIVIHSSRTLDPSQVNRQDGIPVTTATRTLEDLRRTRSHPDFAAALRQAEFGGFVVDFNWPARGLIVEVDGWETHRTRSAFENDRARDLRLKLLGLDVIRFTWRQLIDDPADVAAALRELLRK